MRSWRRWRPVFGACSAIWTFEYEEYDKDSEEYKNYPDQTGKLAIVNHEIDIELPTQTPISTHPPSVLRDSIPTKWKTAASLTFRRFLRR